MIQSLLDSEEGTASVNRVPYNGALFNLYCRSLYMVCLAFVSTGLPVKFSCTISQYSLKDLIFSLSEPLAEVEQDST